jgi:hypothetical protein
MMEEHYDAEDTETITLAGSQPMMNTYSYHTALMAPEFFKGKVKIDPLGGNAMNIAFYDKQEPELFEGQITEWCLDDLIYEVRVIRRTRFFIKGVWIVLFVVQLKK